MPIWSVWFFYGRDRPLPYWEDPEARYVDWPAFDSAGALPARSRRILAPAPIALGRGRPKPAPSRKSPAAPPAAFVLDVVVWLEEFDLAA